MSASPCRGCVSALSCAPTRSACNLSEMSKVKQKKSIAAEGLKTEMSRNTKPADFWFVGWLYKDAPSPSHSQMFSLNFCEMSKVSTKLWCPNRSSKLLNGFQHNLVFWVGIEWHLVFWDSTEYCFEFESALHVVRYFE